MLFIALCVEIESDIKDVNKGSVYVEIKIALVIILGVI